MLGRAVAVLLIIAVANFAAFALVALNIGGDAINGHQEDGRYFLANHGQLTEVTRAVFVYSMVHAISVWVTHGAFLLFAGISYIHRGVRRRDRTE